MATASQCPPVLGADQALAPRFAANDAAESVSRETEKASQLQEFSAALRTAESEMEPAQFEEAMRELAQLAEQALSENAMLAQDLSDELRTACRNGTLRDQQLESLREALQECRAGQRARLERLVEARLVDADQLALCDQAGEFDPEALAAALCEGNSSAAALALGCNRRNARISGFKRGAQIHSKPPRSRGGVSPSA